VLGADVPARDALLVLGGDLQPLEIVVDGRVPDAEGHLVRDEGLVVLEVGRRHLLDHPLVGAQVPGQFADAAFGQPGQRGDVGGSVAELRVEAHDGLGGLVGADDEEAARARDGELRDHPLPGLDVALDVVVVLGRHAEAGAGEAVPEGVHGRCDVDGQGLVGPDELERTLGVLLVPLEPVGQPHGDERRVAASGPDAFAGQLGEPPAEGTVHPAADAEHVPLGAGGREVTGQESDATLDLAGRVEGGGVDDLEFGGDAPLQCTVHGATQQRPGEARQGRRPGRPGRNRGPVR